MEGGKANDATVALERVPVLLGTPGSPGFELADHLLLSDALTTVAQHLVKLGKPEEAAQQYHKGMKPLYEYDREDRKSVACRSRLAECFYALGLIYSKTDPGFTWKVLNQATDYLTELSRESVPGATLRLCLAYNEMAKAIRLAQPNAAGAKDALSLHNDSVTFLRNLNELNTLDNTLRQHLASSLVLNGELQELAGNPAEGLKRHNEAIDLLNELLADAGLTDTRKLECRRRLAEAWTSTGNIHEKSGRKPEAISSLGKALENWNSLPAGDPVVARTLASTREKLSKLNPGG